MPETPQLLQPRDIPQDRRTGASQAPQPVERRDLPPNARTPLQPGEEYIPMVPAESAMREVTPRSVLLGLLFCAIFSMAAAYLALKIGQGIEAAIPISILAIGIGGMLARRSTILENVIVQSIGANSSHVVAGAVFTIPALYMLHDEGVIATAPTWYQIILTAFLGGCLGILFLVPLRRYFMVEQHGQLPWPEATATTEILVSGQKAGDQAKVLAISAVLGIVYDGLITTFHSWKEIIDFKTVGVGVFLRDHFMTLRILNTSAVLAIGYIVGLRYAAVICAGSFLSWFVLVPIIHAIGESLIVVLPPGGVPIGAMSPDDVFTHYVKIIGVGGIAGAGIMGIVRAFPSMIGSMTKGLGKLGSGAAGSTAALRRTDRSLSGKATATGIAMTLAAIFLFYSFGIGVGESIVVAVVGTLLCGVIAFLFAPVSARAIAIVGTNPVSGMTMLTIIVTGVVMLGLGLTGGAGMFVVMLVGGVVCTALCASGALSTDLKIGHWIGATPRNQLMLKFLGTLVAASFCGLAMWIMSRQPEGFGTPSLPAPQATAMKELLVGILGTEDAPLRWEMFGIGVILSIILQMAKVPALAFALGMYLPIQLNVPVLIGGFLAWVVGRERKGEDPARTKAGNNRGILIASGLMAGGALMGIFDGVINMIISETSESGTTKSKAAIHFFSKKEFEGRTSEIISILMLAALCIFMVVYSRRARPEAGAPDLSGH